MRRISAQTFHILIHVISLWNCCSAVRFRRHQGRNMSGDMFSLLRGGEICNTEIIRRMKQEYRESRSKIYEWIDLKMAGSDVQ